MSERAGLSSEGMKKKLRGGEVNIYQVFLIFTSAETVAYIEPSAYALDMLTPADRKGC